ncbi:hypothetical protein BST61_g1967 [Cercospora zeina]
MATAVAYPSHGDIKARLRYLKRAEVYKALRPYTMACKVEEGFPTNNLVFEYGPEELITDIRGLKPGELSLEKNGMVVVPHQFTQPTTDEEAIKKPGGYLDEVREFVSDVMTKEGIPVEEVRIINWVFRTSALYKELFANVDMTGRDLQAHAPDNYVHNDCNYYGGDKRIRAMLGEETDKILGSKRVRLINVWKPINNPVEDCQLAICDASTVQHEKCIHGDFIITPDYVSQTNYAAPCEEQKWYWISNQQVDEPILFKQHDTDVSSNTRYCPHTAFWRNDPRECRVPRESLEVRVLVISSD